MKKIIYAVMIFGLAIDASAMEKQQGSVSEERRVSFAKLRTVEPALVDNVNSVLKTLSRQGNIWLFGKEIPSKCGALRNLLNKEISEAKRTIGTLDFLGKAELVDIKSVESQVSKIQEQWGIVCSTPRSDDGNGKIATAIGELIDSANSLADIIKTLRMGEKKAIVVVPGKDAASDNETEQVAETIARGVNDLTLSDSETEDESSEEEREEDSQGGTCNIM